MNPLELSNRIQKEAPPQKRALITSFSILKSILNIRAIVNAEIWSSNKDYYNGNPDVDLYIQEARISFRELINQNDKMILNEGVNRHAFNHFLIVAETAIRLYIIAQNSNDIRKMVLIALAGLFHDNGYDICNEKIKNGDPKSKYNLHAKKGAERAELILKAFSKYEPDVLRSFFNKNIQKALGSNFFTENNIQIIKEAIMFHSFSGGKSSTEQQEIDESLEPQLNYILILADKLHGCCKERAPKKLLEKYVNEIASDHNSKNPENIQAWYVELAYMSSLKGVEMQNNKLSCLLSVDINRIKHFIEENQEVSHYSEDLFIDKFTKTYASEKNLKRLRNATKRVYGDNFEFSFRLDFGEFVVEIPEAEKTKVA
jgi:hypothetical protein